MIIYPLDGPPAQRSTRTPSLPERQWEDVKPTIQRLYLDEELRLAQVMEIMKKNHDFNATIRMYKAHFKKWNWQKYQNKTLMIAAQRRMAQLDRSGKPTVVKIGEKSISDRDVAYYLKRASEYRPKKVPSSPSPDLMDAMEVSTPVAAEDESMCAMMSQYDFSRNEPGVGQSSARARTPRSSPRYAVNSAVDEVLRASLSPRPQSPPILPAEYRVPEELFQTTQDYFLGSFDSGVWYADGLQKLRSQASTFKGTEPQEWTYKLADCLYFCFWEHSQKRSRRAIGYLATACDLLKNAVLEDYPLLISSIVCRCMMYPQWFEGRLEMVGTLLRYLSGWARLSRTPSSEVLRKWSGLLLQCSSYEVFERILHMNLDIFREKLTEKHNSYLLLLHSSLATLGEKASVKPWESLYNLCLQAKSDKALLVGGWLTSRYIDEGLFDRVEKLFLGTSLDALLSEPNWRGALTIAENLAEAQCRLGKKAESRETCLRIEERACQIEEMDGDTMTVVKELQSVYRQLGSQEDVDRMQGSIDRVNEKMEEATRIALAKLDVGG